MQDACLAICATCGCFNSSTTPHLRLIARLHVLAMPSTNEWNLRTMPLPPLHALDEVLTLQFGTSRATLIATPLAALSTSHEILGYRAQAAPRSAEDTSPRRQVLPPLRSHQVVIVR